MGLALLEDLRTTLGVTTLVDGVLEGLVLGPFDPAADALDASSEWAGESAALAPFNAFCFGILGDFSRFKGVASC